MFKDGDWVVIEPEFGPSSRFIPGVSYKVQGGVVEASDGTGFWAANEGFYRFKPAWTVAAQSGQNHANAQVKAQKDAAVNAGSGYGYAAPEDQVSAPNDALEYLKERARELANLEGDGQDAYLTGKLAAIEDALLELFNLETRVDIKTTTTVEFVSLVDQPF